MSISPEEHIGSFIAPLTLVTGEGEISPRRLRLLAAIGQTGSISAAARSIGMTYKAAWDAVEAMNNLAGTPLVHSQHGGRGGGGARLTPAGSRLVEDMARLETLQAEIMALAERREDIGDSLAILRRLEMKTSARNALHGTVEQVTDGAVNSEVTLRLPGGEALHAIVTRESVADMALEPGRAAYALIKASWVILAPADDALRTSARNRLCGTIRRVEPGAVNAEVVIELSGGNTLAAIITRESHEEMALKDAMPICALVKASHVILGVTD
ncbi:MAG: TOBE domain-containing protein [Halothiobacillaceae bacterium]